MAIGDKKVGARFTAKDDGVKKRFTLMERAAARFGRNAEKSFKRASRGASRFSSVTKGVVAGLGISRGLGLLSQGVGSVVNQFIAFDKAALGATVRFKDIGPTAANFSEKLKEIEKAARDAGATTEFTAAQGAGAMDFLARAGFNSAEAIGSLNSMINLATASGEEFATVADFSSDLLGAFGLDVKDTTQKISNLNRLNDVLVKTANSANVTIEDMFETMKIAGPVATSLGIGLEEVAAATAIMGNAGIKGSQGATTLKNAFLNIATQQKPVVDMMNAIGASIKRGEGGRLLFTETLADITEKTRGMDKLKVAKVFDVLFGKRAIAGVSVLSSNVDALKDFRDGLDDAGKTSKLTADIMRTSLEAKLKTLGSAATEFGFKILAAFRGDAKGGLDSLTESIRNMNAEPFIEDLKIILKVAGSMAKAFALVAKSIDIVGTGLGIAAGNFVLAGEGQQTGQFDQSFAAIRARREAAKQAPNQQEAEARAQQVNVNVGGEINVNGPAGTTAESTGPVGFNTEALGVNG